MTSYILILLLGTQGARGVSLTSVPGFRELAICQSAGEAWKVYAKEELSPRYYCVPVPR